MQNGQPLSVSVAKLENENKKLNLLLGELIATITVNIENGRIQSANTPELLEYVSAIHRQIDPKRYCISREECSYSDCPTAFCDL